MPSTKSITVSLPSNKPIRIHIPAALRHHQIQLQTFLSEHKQYTNLLFGAFIFHPPKADLIPPPRYSFTTNKGMTSNSALNTPIEPSRILLLQRNLTDISFPDLWEVPGGHSELTDPTILHSVAHGTFEATGLRLKRFMRQIGDGEEFESSEGMSFRLNLEIEVAELVDVGKTIECAGLGDVPIELDAHEHQEFVWATEEDIEEEIYPLVVPQQKAVILQAFQLRRGDEKEVRASAVSASKALRQGKSEEPDAGGSG